MGGRVGGTGRTIAKAPFEGIVFRVDLGKERHGFFGTIGVGLIGLDEDVVDGDAGAEVDGIGAYQISVSPGAAKAVDVGVEAIGARDVVRAMRNVSLCKAVSIIARNGMELIR